MYTLHNLITTIYYIYCSALNQLNLNFSLSLYNSFYKKIFRIFGWNTKESLLNPLKTKNWFGEI